MNSGSIGFYSAAQLRELERRAIAAGISGHALMQRAAAAGFRELTRRWPKTRSLAVVCGSGNNGGDGYEIARLARAAGLDVQLLQVGDEPRKEEAAQARKAWLSDGGKAEPYHNQALAAEVVVDAIFGIGLARAPEGLARAAILAINAAHDQGAGVLAVDAPSGLDAERGSAPGEAVHADLTVTFIGRKLGLHSDLAGQVVFDGLQLPPQIYDGVPVSAVALTQDYLKQVLPRRRRSAHKGDMGHVLVVGGDEGMGGAALMAARAALRAGAGLVSVATRASHCAALTAAQPELMCHATDHSVEGPRKLRSLIERATVLALGPGLGRSEWGRAMWAQARTAVQPLVVDADGLNWLSAPQNIGPMRREDWVLTPHPGEAARLLARSTAQVQADRVAAVQALRENFGGVAVLKGAGTLVQGDTLALCPAGNPGMAVGGMGDVLCGLIAGLMAQGLGPEAAARAGVLAHALAGDRAAAAGERGMLPADLLAELRPILNPLSPRMWGEG